MKRRFSQWTVLILTILLGVLIMTQYKIIQYTQKYVSLQDINSLTNTLNFQESENLKLQEQISQLEEKITSYETAILEDGNIEEILSEQIAEFRKISGIEPLSGPGVVVIITDSDRKLFENEDPNNLLVHDLDIMAVVDDLRAAGAEAIAVNKQRILFGITDIKCSGPTIRINDKLYSQPFIIEAIGNRKYLEAAVNAPDKYGEILRRWGIFVEVNTCVYIEVPGYNKSVNFKYINSKEN